METIAYRSVLTDRVMEEANSLRGVFVVSTTESRRRFPVCFRKKFAFRSGMSRVAVASVGHQTVCDIAALSLLALVLRGWQARHNTRKAVTQV